jgi:hypothetical protein
MKSPLARVKEEFGDKEKLVAAVRKLAEQDLWVARESADKGLDHVSNAKLLRLHRIFSEVKEKFGTRAKLIDAILELEKRTKDTGYKARLEKFPVPRLYDMFLSAQKRLGGSDTKKSEPAKAAAPKKAAAAEPKKKAAAKPKKTAAKS